MNIFIQRILEKIIYLFNTVDTYFLISGIFSYLTVLFLLDQPINFIALVAYSVFLWLIFKLADFYLHYLFFLPVFVLLFFFLPNFHLATAGLLLVANITFFYVTQFLFYSIPYIIIIRDYSIPFRVIVNSLITFAPTSSSAIMSIYFSALLSETVYFSSTRGLFSLFLLTAFVLVAALTRLAVPKTPQSQNFKPEPKKLVERVIYLNIDGCRLDKFAVATMPFVRDLEKKSAVFKHGATSVYRALTNPAFASILTGATPRETGAKNNNFHSGVRLQALADLAPTILYGNIHMKDIAKKEWNVKVISLPQHGLRSDDVLLEELKNDLLSTDTKIFIADLSDVDLAGHAYGSYSPKYLEALERTDHRFEEFFHWLQEHKLLLDSLVIIGSDHGQAGMEHAYLFSASEKYVPLIMHSGGVKKKVLEFVPSIIDINLTISYALGIPYCASSRGRALVEVFT